MELRKKGDLTKENMHLDVLMAKGLREGIWGRNELGWRWINALSQLGSGNNSIVSITIAVTKNLFQDFGVKLVGQMGKFLFPVF